ncbi:magnesium transporter [Achromobacter denitrificans]|jgi:magnesium transporter|uniref:Magnesium transporter MgtE n=1 Tax=Achromobacter denitrificans TaxID=32002 RepID=A0A427WJU8_ACHDE|nr:MULTISPECIES: magnesium transporter [Achromobacter]ASC63933.1 magnesium transporter [Achromobacter denitrificans]MBV2162089.1 magnesium transporter [Achromobacter denitrificans]MDF3849304.1 magnesium transporter [Achromobacter denitrificans]MDF3862276.1 magnesium transporter [Achromobacter denitrificans]MDF3944165.1 magnesium transporter [Achromobacter denitrificans]
MTQSAAAQKPPATPRRLDPEDAQHALAEVQERLRRQQLVADLVHRQEEGDSKASLVEDLVHRQHEAELKTLLDGLHPADIAFILESLPKDERQAIWALVSPEHDADVLLEVEDWVRESLIEAMDRQDLVAATGNMDADELADLAPDLPPDVVAEVQKGLTEEERAQLLEAMGYPEDSVGAIMDFEMVRVREDVTLEVVLRYLRRLHELPDHTDQIFVVDRQDKLQGILPLSRLLVSEPETEVRAVMNSDFLALNPLDSDADAAGAFERYDLVSAPVMDDQGRLIGRVTIADVVDVMREDSQEQALSRAGLQEEDIFAPVATALRNRAPWLLFNLCTAATASFVASQFEGTVSQIVILAFLMSIVAGIGGNSGNQTMTLIIRALAMGRITGRNLWQLVKRELLVTLMVGLCGSLVAALFAWAISHSVSIALVMMAAMVCNMLVGASVGVLVPMVRARFGKDPAMGSSVLLTFATDSLGFFIFLGLATLFLL